MSKSSDLAMPFESEVGDAASTLFLAPSMDPAGDEGCVRLLSSEPLGDANLLAVSLTDSPDDKMGTWRAHFEEDPAQIRFIATDDGTRSVATSSGPVAVPGEPMTVESISNPADLTGLGIKISRALTDWEDDERRITVCFDSLTALLQFVELDSAFRFLHVLATRMDSVDAAGHFHMDPTAHDEREINTLASVFDAVVEWSDGEWTVRSR